MNALNFHQEQRQEPRLPIKLAANICLDIFRNNKTLIAEIENISLHGLQSKTNVHLSPGQTVRINYLQTLNGQETSALGNVKWCLKNTKKFISGIELLEKQSCNFSLEQVSLLFEDLKIVYIEETTQEKQNQKMFNDYYHRELYIGFFFNISCSFILNSFLSAASQINLNQFKLADVLYREKHTRGENHINNELHSALCNTGEPYKIFNKLIMLCKTLQEESIISNRSARENRLDYIELNKNLINRVNSLKEKLDFVSIPHDITLLENSKNILLYGPEWRLNHGLDLFLLYSCQFIIFSAASKINISTQEKQNMVEVNIQHNGSETLSSGYKQLYLHPDKKTQKNVQTPRDCKHLLWLDYILNFFLEYYPQIFVYNEAGNNLISLQLHPYTPNGRQT